MEDGSKRFFFWKNKPADVKFQSEIGVLADKFFLEHPNVDLSNVLGFFCGEIKTIGRTEVDNSFSFIIWFSFYSKPAIFNSVDVKIIKEASFLRNFGGRTIEINYQRIYHNDHKIRLASGILLIHLVEGSYRLAHMIGYNTHKVGRLRKRIFSRILRDTIA